MPKLIFIRQKMTTDCWDYYETKTDVFVFGDVAGFRYFRRKILQAVRSSKNTHLLLLASDQNSMKGVILPARKTRGHSVRLKFIERFVVCNRKPNMELIIAGNARGYRYFANSLASLIQSKKGDLSEHLHLDDAVDRRIARRSVALNIRAPLVKWDYAKLGEFGQLVKERGEDFIPEELKYRLASQEDYEEVTYEESEAVDLYCEGVILEGVRP